MAPVSLFWGAHNSGKSSIGRFLMMLKQTVESSDSKTVFNASDKNAAVQLSSYQEMVFRRDPTKKINFEYLWKTLNALKLKNHISAQQFSCNVEVATREKDRHALILKPKDESQKDEFPKMIFLPISRQRI